jgi:hypothetical protein
MTPDASRCLWIPPDASRCLQMPPDVSRYPQMPPDASRRLVSQIPPDASRCLQISPDWLQRYTQNAPKLTSESPKSVTFGDPGCPYTPKLPQGCPNDAKLSPKGGPGGPFWEPVAPQEGPKSLKIHQKEHLGARPPKMSKKHQNWTHWACKSKVFVREGYQNQLMQQTLKSMQNVIKKAPK